MLKRYIERLAIPMFSIGLLAFVLGIFSMNQSASFGASSSTSPATKTITIRYLAAENNPDGTNSGICPGQERLTSNIGTGMLSPLEDFMGKPRSGFTSVTVDTCQVTFKVLK
jgi:hypothetical protein